jgi:hypothetical protein
MTQDRILTLPEAAQIAREPEQTIRDWIIGKDGGPKLVVIPRGKINSKGPKNAKVRESVLWAYFKLREDWGAELLATAKARDEWTPEPRKTRAAVERSRGELGSMKEILGRAAR